MHPFNYVLRLKGVANIPYGLTSISYAYAYQGDNNFVVASNDRFFRAYGC